MISIIVLLWLVCGVIGSWWFVVFIRKEERIYKLDRAPLKVGELVYLGGMSLLGPINILWTWVARRSIRDSNTAIMKD